MVEPSDRWGKTLIPMALQNLTAKYPELEIQVNYTILPYNDAREHMLEAMSNRNTGKNFAVMLGSSWSWPTSFPLSQDKILNNKLE